MLVLQLEGRDGRFYLGRVVSYVGDLVSVSIRSCVQY
jgi:hypothetical protein